MLKKFYFTRLIIKKEKTGKFLKYHNSNILTNNFVYLSHLSMQLYLFINSLTYS